MSDNKYLRSICLAIEIITNQKVAQADFDKTKKVTIEKVLDATTGKYLVRHLDSTFTAWSIGTNVTYAVGDLVILLSPNGKTDSTQVILGSANPTPRQYSIKNSNVVSYNALGTNAITMNLTIGISSYDKKAKVLYKALLELGEENIIDVNQLGLKQYLQEGNAAVTSCILLTDLDMNQVGGIYGIEIDYSYGRLVQDELGIHFVGNKKTINLNSTFLLGYPYGKLKPTKIEVALSDILPSQFHQIEEIRAVSYGFNKNENEENNPDIFISDLVISSALIFNIELKGNYLLNIDYSTNGNRLNLNEKINEILLKAQIKIDGKLMTSTDNVEYYWFRQNAAIISGEEGYYFRAGAGWLGITGLQGVNTKSPSPGKSTYTITAGLDKFDKAGTLFAYLAGAKQKINKYKCIAVFDGLEVSNQVIVYNENLTSNILLVSSDKLINGENRTQYRMGYGSPTFTCKVKGIELKEGENFTYNWLIAPKRKSSISEKDGENTYTINIKDIGTLANIACSVYKVATLGLKEILTYLGTDSITLTNINLLAETYELVIQNGTQVFKYDSNGISPCNEAQEDPLKIEPLTFFLRDPQGLEISYDSLINLGANIYWYIPKIDSGTLLRYNGTHSPNLGTGLAAAANFDVYSNLKLFPFAIADTYQGDSFLNYIRLNITYKLMSFNAYTNFTFAKDGDLGTNGTSYMAKIVPQNEEWASSDRIYGVRIRVGDNYSFGKFFNDINSTPTLKIIFDNKVYYNSKQLDSEVNTTWNCPIKSKDIAWIQCNSKGLVTVKTGNTGFPSNIIRATAQILEGLNIYSLYPIYFNYLYAAGLVDPDASEKVPLYRFKLEPKSGYKYVKYSEDGTYPVYNHNPFKVYVLLLIGLTYTRMADGLFTCKWEVYPKNNNNLKPLSSTNGTTQTIEPKDTFDGDNLLSAVRVIFKVKNETEEEIEIGYLHIPIYMYINRYNHKALNDWDGNSIDLGLNSGVILSPQIGAGKKGDNNTFTGIFMGEVSKGDSSSNEVGLMGYNEGLRTIFLDALKGKAEFGKNNAAKIIIDPSSSTAIIKSGNYSTKDKTGLQIDLTTPLIKYGSGNFTVDKDGKLTAKGGGQIAGWKIGDNTLTSNNNHIVLNSTGNTTIQAKNGDGNTVFSVSNNGYLTATSGKIGGWTVGSITLTGGGTTFNSNGSINSNNKFKVDTNGKMTATDADISGKITATSGKIGGWNINNTTLFSGNLKLDSGGTITGGASSATGWGISANGSAYFNNASIGGISINSNGMSGTGWYIRPGEAHFTGLSINLSTGSMNTGSASGGYGGGSISGGWGGLGGNYGTFNPNNIIINNENMGNYIKGLVVDTLNVTNEFTFNNHKVKWQPIVYVNNILPEWKTINGQSVVTDIKTTYKVLYTLCQDTNA